MYYFKNTIDALLSIFQMPLPVLAQSVTGGPCWCEGVTRVVNLLVLDKLELRRSLPRCHGIRWATLTFNKVVAKRL